MPAHKHLWNNTVLNNTVYKTGIQYSGIIIHIFVSTNEIWMEEGRVWCGQEHGFLASIDFLCGSLNSFKDDC